MTMCEDGWGAFCRECLGFGAGAGAASVTRKPLDCLWLQSPPGASSE